jgi:Ca-activated chloride channel family protein
MRYLRTSPTIITVLLACALALSALIPATAQEPPKPPPPKPTPTPPSNAQRKGAQRQGAQAEPPAQDLGESIIVNTELVQLDVTVIDQNNSPVFNLDKEHFVVYEDKVKQMIEDVSRAEVPVSFGLVIDTSGSMRPRLQTVSNAATGLIKQMRPDDEAFVAQFKAEPELVRDFTRDRRELEDALGELYTGGGTSLLDAIIAAADYAQEKGKQRRKALIIITDGLERDSSVKENQVKEALKENEVQVYLIGFIDEDEPGGLFSKAPGKKAKELLGRLAEDSGGRAFFPKDLSEMSAIAAQIAKDLRTQYVISYYPSNEKRDGTFRTVRVMVNAPDNRKLIARTRQGYYARDDRGTLTPVKKQ